MSESERKLRRVSFKRPSYLPKLTNPWEIQDFIPQIERPQLKTVMETEGKFIQASQDTDTIDQPIGLMHEGILLHPIGFVATEVGISRRQLSKLARLGKFSAYKGGREYFINLNEAHQYTNRPGPRRGRPLKNNY